MKSVVIGSVLTLTALVSQAQAGGCGNCPQCGGGCQKVCRVKCEMRTVTTFKYCCKCEDFCLPGPSKCCGKKWVPDCASLFGGHYEQVWGPPCCGRVRHRKVLLKIPVTKQVPAYTCEVVNLCGKCGMAQVDEAATAEMRAKEIVPVSAEEPLVSAGESATATAEKPAESVGFFSRIFSR